MLWLYFCECFEKLYKKLFLLTLCILQAVFQTAFWLSHLTAEHDIAAPKSIQVCGLFWQIICSSKATWIFIKLLFKCHTVIHAKGFHVLLTRRIFQGICPFIKHWKKSKTEFWWYRKQLSWLLMLRSLQKMIPSWKQG